MSILLILLSSILTINLLLQNGHAVSISILPNTSTFHYDTSNGSIGSLAYSDIPPTNPDIFITICDTNLTPGGTLDIGYATAQTPLFTSILTLPLTITNTTPINTSMNCSFLNPELSTLRAVYPGYPWIAYTPEGINRSTTYLPLGIFLNGSFSIQVHVDPYTRTYYFSVRNVYDENKNLINASQAKLAMSIIRGNETLREALRRSREAIAYNGSFEGGEKILVNGLVSLEIKIFNACGEINESGFYLLNTSVWDANETCIRIENQSNLILHFAGELIDGDGNKSMNNTCSVLIKDSTNVTLEDPYIQQYAKGICVYNSTHVNVIMNKIIENEDGLYAENSSIVLYNVSFTNSVHDIIANNSYIATVLTNVTGAMLNSTFQNVIVRSVYERPPPPNITDIRDIGQYVEAYNISQDGWMDIAFHYTEPLPNNVVADNLSIYKYDGIRVNSTENTTGTGNMSTNTSGNTSTLQRGWEGNWTKLHTLIDTTNHIIIGPNVSSFSIFAPFGFNTTPIPEPVPQPTPQPTPTSGAPSGGGGSPALTVVHETAVLPEVIRLNLTLPKNVSLMQGEAGEVPFNITNVGRITVKNITIRPAPRRGWTYGNASIPQLERNETRNGSFLLAPWERETPGTYRVPVYTIVTFSNGSLYIARKDILTVIVTPRSKLHRIRILEYPPAIRIPPGGKVNVSFLIKNIGDVPLKNITLRVQGADACIRHVTGILPRLSVGDLARMASTFQARFEKTSCDGLLKWYDEEGKLLGFAPVTFIIQPTGTFERYAKISILLIIFIIWTLLTIFIIQKRLAG